jgi:hypothetical protein
MSVEARRNRRRVSRSESTGWSMFSAGVCSLEIIHQRHVREASLILACGGQVKEQLRDGHSMDTSGTFPPSEGLEVLGLAGGPTEIRTRVSAVRGQRPWPLDDGANISMVVVEPPSRILIGGASPLADYSAIKHNVNSGAGIRTPILRSRAACPACWTTPECSSLWVSSLKKPFSSR